MQCPRSFLSFFVLAAVTGCSDGVTSAANSLDRNSGSLIVFRRELLPGSSPRATVIDAESGTTIALAPWVPDGPSTTFSRDGKWMAWIEVRKDSFAEEYCYSDVCYATRLLQELHVERIGHGPGTVLTPRYHYDQAPSFSPDGERLVVLRESYDGEQQMVTIARDGSDERPVLLKSRRRRDAPDWSPSGATILYRRPEINALYLVDPEGKAPRPIATELKSVMPATWSPDGKEIAAVVWDPAHTYSNSYYALAILGADGTMLHHYAFVDGIRRPVWSPDGSRLAYGAWETLPGSEYSGRMVIRILTVATGDVRTITPAGYEDDVPVWRP
jgi:Tol biopolymer transport system component